MTAVSFFGGVAWLLALFFRRRLPAFLAIYFGVTAIFVFVAWIRGKSGPKLIPRTPVSLLAGDSLKPQSWLYPALNRDHVTWEMRRVAQDLARHMDATFPGTVTVTLDGSFPLFDGFPLLPHLSHDDGEKLDLAFYWQDAEGTYLPGASRSPIGF
ncbi:MAG: hypothetical protein AAGF13_04835 [Pseudomonadota bacterium]